MTTQTPTMELTLQGDREIRITRSFDAPRELVFDAVTKPEHIAQWYGPRGHVMKSITMDFRPGGTYRFDMADEKGNEFAFLGEFQEIVRPERVVQTWAFEPWKDRPSVETMTLTEQDGLTTIVVTSVLMGAEDRDGLVASGMEGGARESYERLTELLAKLQGR